MFEGMASTFGNVDLDGDVIEPGAFAASIGNPGRIKMLWQHDSRQPIGVWTDIRETDKGLRVKGELILDVQRARETHALMKRKAIDALSIGFMVPKGGAEMDPATNLRRISKIDLMEISVVTFPANTRARIGRVKGEPHSKRHLEDALHHVLGYSRAESRAMAAASMDALRSGGERELLDAIKVARETLARK